MSRVLGGSRMHRALLAAAVAGAMVVAGCGSDDDDTSTAASTGSATAAATTSVSAGVEKAKQLTAESFETTGRELPQTGPEAVRDKTVWAIVCNSQGPGCARPAEAAVEAGKLLGWKMKILDGKQDPKLYNAHIRSAAAAGVDAVMLFGIDCAQVTASIEEAKKAGVKVYGANSLDCDDKYASGGTKLFDEYLRFGPDDAGYGEFADEVVGPAIARWLIAKTDGKAKVIELQEDDAATTRHVGEAFRATMEAECEECEVWQVPHTGPEIFNGKLQSKVAAALTKYPEADAVMAPLDISAALAAAPAVEQARASGREILLLGQEGNPENIELIRKGVQSYATGRPMDWLGWATVDGVNRMLAGEPQVDPGMTIRPVDADHLPQGSLDEQVAADTGFEENYKKIWGVG